ncbi:MAG TPA: cation:proton antiporter, partial [Terriglobia bacterium]|nr:cation:proton antiporter [Terriglobia bacterium]
NAAQFENVTRGFGTLALILILFEGGLELDVNETLRHLGGGLMLSWSAYVITAALVAAVAKASMLLSWRSSMLVGAVLGCVSSTIMLPILQQIPVRRPVKLTLLVESAIGDVLAVLTVGVLLNLPQSRGSVVTGLVGGFAFEVGVSIVFGVGAGVLWSWLMPRLSEQRFWQTLTFAAVLLLYAGTSAVNASGLFSVLVFGVVLANLPQVRKQLLTAEMGIDLPEEGSHLKILSFHSELAFLVRSFFFVMIGAVVHFSGLRANAIPILGFAGAILVARWQAAKLSRWTWKEISTLERELIIILLPRGLITAVLAIQVIEERGAEFGFLRAAAFAIILLTNGLVVLGCVRARRAIPLSAPARQIFQEPVPE